MKYIPHIEDDPRIYIVSNYVKCTTFTVHPYCSWKREMLIILSISTNFITRAVNNKIKNKNKNRKVLAACSFRPGLYLKSNLETRINGSTNLRHTQNGRSYRLPFSTNDEEVLWETPLGHSR